MILLAIGLAFGPVASHGDNARAAPESIRRSDMLISGVNGAVDKGAEWVLSQQDARGGFAPHMVFPAARTALAYLTLRVCGVPLDDERLELAYFALREEYAEARFGREDVDLLRTYTAALIMMAIEEHGRGEDRGRRRPRRRKNGEPVVRLNKSDMSWMRELTRYMTGNQKPNGSWSYGSQQGEYEVVRDPSRYDHSNTQYALLGLKSASRCGVKLDSSVYAKALRHLVGAQERSGPEVRRAVPRVEGETFAQESDRARGWGYFSLTTTRSLRGRPVVNHAFGSMTAGCLGAVVICRSELLGTKGYTNEMDARAETSIWDGLAWLGQEFTVKRNPGLGGWHLYYLYAIERAGVLAGVDRFGERDWYGEGAKYLVESQDTSGAWTGTAYQKNGDSDAAGRRLVDTCFALLFLKNGTLPVARGAVTPSGAADRIDFDAARNVPGRDLNDFLDLIISRWARATTDRDRAALRHGTASVGPRVILPLLRRMNTGHDRQRGSAHAIVVAITGQKFAFDPEAPRQARADALLAWEEWYMAHLNRLSFDDASGTLITQ